MKIKDIRWLAVARDLFFMLIAVFMFITAIGNWSVNPILSMIDAALGVLNIYTMVDIRR